MPQGLFSIGGIASGLDTNDIVNQLMQLERQPVVRLEQRQQNLQTTKDAWGQITQRLSALRSATDAIRRPDRFDAFTSVTSSDPDAVAVTRGSGRPADSELSFTVEQLATRAQQTSADTFGGRDEALGDRTFSLVSADGRRFDITDELAGDATLADLVTAINDTDSGVRASALQVSPGRFQLVLDATETGEQAGGFSVEGTGWEHVFVETQAGVDAQLRVGGIDISRASNTIDDLLEGASITLNRVTQDPVTVSAQRDVDGAVDAVTSFVNEINKAVGRIGELTDYDPETREAGPLQGQFSANQLAFALRGAISAPLEGRSGLDGLASSVGLSVDRNGVVQVEEAKLRQAFADDFEGTARRFSRTGSASDSSVVTSVSGPSGTQAGSYDVKISRAAEIARVTGATPFPSGPGEPKTFMIRSPGGTVVTVTIDTTQDDVATAAAKIQAKLQDAGITNLTAGVDGDALSLSSTGYGDHVSFEVTALDDAGEPTTSHDAFGLVGTHRGVDVAGTIDGQDATGRGRMLTAADGPAEGLRVETVGGLDIAPGETLELSASFWHGFGGVMDSTLQRAEGRSGSIARAQASLDSQMRIYQDRIAAFEQRLESREVTLRRQFVALETAMDRFNSQGEWLQGQISQLNGLNAQRK